MFKTLTLFSSFLLSSAVASAQWQPQTSEGINPNYVIQSIAAVDENVVWAVADSTFESDFTPKFLRTTDGGKTWTVGTVAGAVDFFMFDITALDSNTAWVTTNDVCRSGCTGGIYKTIDGGKSWNKQATIQSAYIHFFDAQHGVEINGPFVYTTNNGGTTWTQVQGVPSLLLDEFYPAISTSNARAQVGHTIWLGTTKGRVYRGTARGHNWTVSQTSLGLNRVITSLAFQDSCNGLAVSALDDNVDLTANQLARTGDGGRTWTTINAPSTPTATSMTYVPETAGTYVIVSSTIAGEIPGSAYTADGGATWTMIDDTQLNAVAFVSPNVGWAGGVTTATHGGMFKWLGMDISSPRPGHTPIPMAESDTEVAVEATINEDDLVEASLLFRRGGESDFRTLPMLDQSNDTFVGNIAAGEVTARGVEYRIEAMDNAGNTGRLPFSSFSVRVHVTDGVSTNEAQPHGSAQTAYRIFSVPLDLDDKSPAALLVDDLGEYDVTRWRFSEYLADNTYREFPEMSAIESGRGYWFAVSEPARVIDTGAGTSNTTAEEFQIKLARGWNLVGTPFNFPIPVENLRLGSGIAAVLRSYTGAWNDLLGSPVSQLVPFEGYAIFNELAGSDVLFINPDLSSAGVAKASLTAVRKHSLSFPRRRESRSHVQPGRETPQEFTPAKAGAGVTGVAGIKWSLRILAQCQDARDLDNIVGASPFASDGWDPLDFPEPPPVGEYVVVYFPRPEWGRLSKRFCTDFRPTEPPAGSEPAGGFSGHAWEFEVKSNIRDRVHLTFEGLETVPGHLEVWLVDERLSLTQNLREQNGYFLAAPGEKHPRRLKLLVGKSESLREELASVQTVPDDFELSQNFPNPFNPVTTIRYGLPREETVTLRVFNILGELVATLLDEERRSRGYHAAIWDGQDRLGRQVASGVYVYQLVGGDSRLTKKMALVR